MTSLIERVEAGSAEQQRELLVEAFNVVHPYPGSGHYLKDPIDWSWDQLQTRFRKMLDAEAYESAALMLLPEGWFLTGGGWIGVEGKGFGFGLQDQLLTSGEKRERKRKGMAPTKWTGNRHAATLALALCAAALKAKGTDDAG